MQKYSTSYNVLYCLQWSETDILKVNKKFEW